ncbi:hypothetical protein AB0C12_37690 [Actinoplanes sp. NPDC048967]|uniref:hypothetical protein n=1 Tax=Actinoplanes sp. NPDC048967 TaxID=3155269 RepID=UPI0033DA4989
MEPVQGAQPSADDGVTTTAGEKTSDDDSAQGRDRVSAGLLDGADALAAGSRALAEASRTFRLQTNQQINIFGTPDGARPFSVTALSADTLSRVRGSFVQSNDYPALWDRLLDQHLVVLSGGPGRGKRHAAMHALDAVCDGRVHELTARGMAELTVAELSEDTGYLWTGLADNVVAEAHEAELLREALRTRRSRMVVIWPASATWPFELDELRQLFTATPDLSAVLRQHLQAGLDEDPRTTSAVASLLDDPLVAEALARLAGAEEAARLGAALRDVVRDGGSPADVLNRFAASAEQTSEWFATLKQREDRAFALALGALDGLSFPTVVAGARRLDEMLQAAEDPEGRIFIRPVERPAHPLLKAVNARRAAGELERSYGKVPVTVVRSNREDFPRRMLTALWQEFPYLQEIYLEWLGHLVGSDDPYVRDRAAVVTGLLAEHDFDFIRVRVLLEWAGNERSDVRRAAGVALRASALSGTLKEIVWELLDDWASPGGTPKTAENNRRLTAAAALGDPVGGTDCRRALDIINRRLLDRQPGSYPDRRILATARAVVELFGDGSSTQSVMVLEQMVDWIDKKEIGPHNVAVGALIGIVGRSPDAGDGEGRRIPPVLRAAVVEPENLPRIAYLWRRALDDRLMGPATLRALRQLAEHVDVESAEERTLVELVRTLPETARELRTLVFEARQWTREESHAPILDRLLTALSNDGECR